MTDATRSLRWARESDHELLGRVMFDAVRNGRSRYTDAQRAAWTPAPRRGPDWDRRLRSQDIIVAEAGEDILGFMSLAPGGYVDFAFIRPRAQGSGLFRLLYERIAERAAERGEARLWVHASLMAEPAFRALGFDVVRRETVVIGDQPFDRAEMERQITPADLPSGTQEIR